MILTKNSNNDSLTNIHGLRNLESIDGGSLNLSSISHIYIYDINIEGCGIGSNFDDINTYSEIKAVKEEVLTQRNSDLEMDNFSDAIKSILIL